VKHFEIAIVDDSGNASALAMRRQLERGLRELARKGMIQQLRVDMRTSDLMRIQGHA
jgi:hypothetical protein